MKGVLYKNLVKTYKDKKFFFFADNFNHSSVFQTFKCCRLLLCEMLANLAHVNGFEH
jgi:hypothetical protein